MDPLREVVEELPGAVFADVLESDEAYLIVLDLPGVTDDTLDIWIEDSTLHVDAYREKDIPEEYSYIRENRSLFLDLEVPLPPTVDTNDGVFSATIERGTLELEIPKETQESREIPIQD